MEHTIEVNGEEFANFGEAADAGYPFYCEWFLGCNNVAVGATAHPILGAVPTCAACAEKVQILS